MLIAGFWLLVFLGIIWQVYFIDNQKPLKDEIGAIPTLHYVPPPTPTPVPKVVYLRQTRFIAERCKDPAHVNFYKAKITVYNPSSETATNIQLRVRPYRGAVRVGGTAELDDVLPENDPISKITNWVLVPDLAPKASVEVTCYFRQQDPFLPAGNPGPVITYHTPLLGDVTTPDTVLARLSATLSSTEMVKLSNPPHR